MATKSSPAPDAITAKGVIAWEAGKPGQVEEFTIDLPGPGEALVRILASGVCHTDLSAKNGVFGTSASRSCSGTRAAGSSSASAKASPTSRKVITSSLPGERPVGRAGSAGGSAASLRGQSQRQQGMRTMDGEVLTPILGIGTFCTHTLVHAKQCIPIDRNCRRSR